MTDRRPSCFVINQLVIYFCPNLNLFSTPEFQRKHFEISLEVEKNFWIMIKTTTFENPDRGKGTLRHPDKFRLYAPFCHKKRGGGDLFGTRICSKNLFHIKWSKQDHRRWRYHRRLLDYQSPFFQLKYPLDHRIPGFIKFLWIIKAHTFIWNEPMTIRSSDHERSWKTI